MLKIGLATDTSTADLKVERDVGCQRKHWWTVAAAGLPIGMADG